MAAVAGAGLLVLMVLFSADAIARYGLGTTVPLKYELTELVLMPGVVTLSLAWVYRHRGHVALTLVYDAVASGTRRVLAIAHAVLILMFAILISYYTAVKVVDAFAQDLVMVGEIDWRLWMCWLPVPLGLAVFTVRVAVDLATLSRGGQPESASGAGHSVRGE